MNKTSDYKNLSDLYEAKGWTCPICCDCFDLSQPGKKPAQPAACMHSLCIDCLKNPKTDLRNGCPICRTPLKNLADRIRPNCVLISAMETINEMWNQIHSQPGSERVEAPSAKQPFAKPAVMEIEQAVPEHFECIALAEARWNHKNVGDEIAALLPLIAQTMGWGAIAKELQSDFERFPKQWVLMTDLRTQESQGVALLKPVIHNAWESHWTGVKNNKTELFVELYKFLIESVAAQGVKNNPFAPNNWKEISLTTYFNYDTETQWLLAATNMLHELQIDYERQRFHRDWGTQIKLTAYPVPKQGHYYSPLWPEGPTKRLEQDAAFEDSVRPELNRCLETLGLNKLFTFWAAEFPNPQHVATEIKHAFSANPENFFIYAIGGEAKGFMRFARQSGNLKVTTCKLLADSYKYADHFMQEFAAWATKKPIYSKGRSAQKVKFSCALSASLCTAIEKNTKDIEIELY